MQHISSAANPPTELRAELHAHFRNTFVIYFFLFQSTANSNVIIIFKKKEGKKVRNKEKKKEKKRKEKKKEKRKKKRKKKERKKEKKKRRKKEREKKLKKERK